MGIVKLTYINGNTKRESSSLNRNILVNKTKGLKLSVALKPRGAAS